MRNRILNFCQKDHKKISNLYGMYVENKTKDCDVILKYFKQFKCSLHCHMVIEEDVLFSFYESRNGFDHIVKLNHMLKEHDMIRDLLNRIQVLIQSDDRRTANLEMKLMSVFQLHWAYEDEMLIELISLIKTEEEEENLISDLSRFSSGCCQCCISDCES